jgi:ABC-type multidrug transport system ATPase subunit
MTNKSASVNNIAIEAKGLVKQLREIRAVDDLSFTVYRNDIFGFLGPNGSGKSTTIRMLLTLIRPDAGTINILGMPLHENRMNILSRVGAFIEKPDFYEYLGAEKNLRLLMRY